MNCNETAQTEIQAYAKAGNKQVMQMFKRNKEGKFVYIREKNILSSSNYENWIPEMDWNSMLFLTQAHTL